MALLRVEPEVVAGLASQFRDLGSQFEELGSFDFDLSSTGDASLTGAIEQFLEQSRGGVGELLSQFGEVQQVLTATAQGYSNVDAHVETGMAENV